MNETKQTFNSSLGKKLIMALTGLFLSLFLIVHLGGNLLLFKNDNGYSFNVYANFLTHFPPIEVIAYILYACILIHTIYAIILTTKIRKARPVDYAVSTKSDVSFSSKNMGLLGSILFLFIVIHMGDFWLTYKFKHILPYKEYRTNLLSGATTASEFKPESADFEKSISTVGDYEVLRVKDLHARISDSFSHAWYVIFYVIAMVVLAFHLKHGFQSSFHTLGWIHRKYKGIIYFIGKWVFAVLIPLGFALMPIVYFLMSPNKTL